MADFQWAMQQIADGRVVVRDTPDGPRYMRPTDADIIPRIIPAGENAAPGFPIFPEDLSATDWRLADVQ